MSLMKRANPARRIDGIEFHFLGAEEDSYLTSSVVVREGEMVLDIPGGYGPYLIVGQPKEHWFEGSNTVRASSNRTDAKWANVGGTYVGVWVEDGYYYLFSFELPAARV